MATEKKYEWLKEENIVSLPDALNRVIAKNPKRTAINYFGKKISYEDLGKYAGKFAEIYNWLSAEEPTQSNNIALLMPNIPQFIFAYYGAHLAGKTAVPVNFSSIAKELKTKPVKDIKITEEIAAQLTDSKPGIIVAADFFWPILKQIMDKIDAKVIITSPADFLPFPLNKLYCLKALKEGKYVKISDRELYYFKTYSREDCPTPDCGTIIHRYCRKIYLLKDLLASGAGADSPKKSRAINDIAQLQYTGGTTGVPKGAMLTHRNVMTNALQCREHLKEFLKQGEVVLGVLPFFHSYGLTACLNMTLLTLEGTLVLMPSFTPKEALHLIEKEKITVFPGVNRMFQLIADYSKTEKYNLSSLKICVSGAGALHQAVKEKYEKATGSLIVEGYGLSEASPVVSVTLPSEKKEKSIGRPLPLTEVKIVDLETGEELPANQDGEIVVSGPQVMAGYYNKPEETEKVIKNGRLHTGDIGHFDEEGFLFITDREKDMIKILGENVYPRDIEEYLLKHPAVKKCVVIGAPDAKKGEAAVAFVALEKSEAMADLKQYASKAPHNLWTPREIHEIAENQFSEWEDILGKVKRRKIRQYYKENHVK